MVALGVDDHDAVKVGLQVFLLLDLKCVLVYERLCNHYSATLSCYLKAWPTTVKITALDLSRCGIDDATVVRLGNALKVCERSCLLIASSTLLLKTCKPRLAPPGNRAFSFDF